MPDACFQARWLDTRTLFKPIYDDDDWTGARLNAFRSVECNLIISHNTKAQTTFTVFHMSREADLATMMSKVLDLKDYTFQPALLPFLLTQYHMFQLRWFQSTVHNDLDVTSLDVTNMPRGLTALTNAMAMEAIVVAILVGLVEFMSTMIDTHRAIGPDDMLTELRYHVDSMREECRDSSMSMQHRKESVQAMVQMVYAVLQQRDNEINHRYGADMRVITAITLVFLPGTFVATLFSASFWNFAPDNTGSKVSGWVWLYFVATAILTLLVLSVWRGFTVLKQFKKTALQVWRRNPVLAKLRKEKKALRDVETGDKVD
ncbi:hypothetical protein T440DRAFT_151375 [Plenodomus tracheiphilus IPT5]|uniref:Uncharacterized protein n=1 Tax=Plenodomus tracheiphilus IPT5 TaxID=1408161 RepID=A0A6A7B2V8_9PLEO|nr:hypothetical protein T440DRAFT_151375 [Plenodomus tracheiphilus IPT5]